MTMGMKSSSMLISMYLTTSYIGTPVIFESLYATDRATCFAIFVILFAVGFVFRGFAFINSYIEQKIFKSVAFIEEAKSQLETALDERCFRKEEKMTATQEKFEVDDLRRLHSPETYWKERPVLIKFLSHNIQSIYQDFIRLILTFIQIVLAYALMLAVMTCILTYFFAVCLGVTFGEIFF